MGFLDKIFSFFKKKEKKEETVIGYSIDELEKGDIVEIAGETWEVIEKGYYDYGEWKEKSFRIRSSRSEGFLSKDEEGIYFFTEDDIRNLSLDPISYLKKEEDLPEEISFKGRPFRLKFSAGAYYVTEKGSSPVIVWDFEDTEGNLLEILQWSDEDFEVLSGRRLEEWEIENVLRRG